MKPTSFLWANAYHEAGHAIAGWALDLCVLEIRIRDDRPGEHAKFCGAERLSLVDRIALLNAGRQAEELFGHRLPSWATDRDRENTLNAIAAEGIKETAEMKQWIDEGKKRARELLEKHDHEVHRLAARLIECRHMTGDEFKLFIEGAKSKNPAASAVKREAKED
jgi:ATP-dependent Zn protease